MSGRPQCLYVQEHIEQIISLVRGKGLRITRSNEPMRVFTRQLHIYKERITLGKMYTNKLFSIAQPASQNV